MNETEVAAAIAAGTLESPQRFGESFLVALRISGTGLSERPALGEKVFRDPLIWLAESTQARCNGLTVTLDHPGAAVLNTEEYAARAVGAIILPYVADRTGIQNATGPDLWGIARLFLDADMMGAISKQSTSPGVAFTKSDGNQRIVLDDGAECLVENSPTDINHCAIVLAGDGAGVWDKGDDDARGIRFDNNGDNTMTTEEEQAAADKARKDAEEQAHKDAEGGNIDKLLKGMDSMTKCMDAMSARLDAVEKRTDKSRKDGEGESEEEKAAKERADRARKDAELMNHGTHPLTAAQADQARKDSAALADVQARADTVAQAWGKRAPAPMMGETVLGYRKRLVRGFQRHSTAWKAADLYPMTDAAVFGNIEEQIYADALVASRTPEVEGSDYVKRVTYSEAGHKETRWFGNQTIFKKLSAPTMRATAFLTPVNRN
jgi:hypothetical protein